MSVNVKASCDSSLTPAPLDSFERTTDTMHRIYFSINNQATWYAIMREARQQFGSGWSSQPKFKRKLERTLWVPTEHWCWFCVPDPAFGTWISVKLGVGHSHQPGK